jgi:hypothetical protein
MAPFALTKWYLDCVDADGRAAIVYWASIAAHGLSLSWHGITRHQPGSAPDVRSSVRTVAAPEWRDGRLEWRSEPLGVAVTCAPRVPPCSMRLLDQPEGVVDWRNVAPCADVAITSKRHPPIAGSGYAERLTMSVAPWRLPIRQLRWGRWISRSGARAVVWIDWRGLHPLTAVFLDGVRAPHAAVAEECITAGSVQLALSNRRTLHDRSVRDLLSTAGPVASWLPDSWLQVEDRKWLAEGRLRAGHGEPESGLAIFELVVLP